MGCAGAHRLATEAEGAQRAITHVRPMEHLEGYTIVECRLETGRTHQIRIHLSEIGHRLCGEKVYTHRAGRQAAGGHQRRAAAGAARGGAGIPASDDGEGDAVSDAAAARSSRRGCWNCVSEVEDSNKY